MAHVSAYTPNTVLIHSTRLYTCCCDKIPDQSNLEKEGFILAHSLRMQSIMVGKTWIWELEKTGHTAPADKKQKEKRK